MCARCGCPDAKWFTPDTDERVCLTHFHDNSALARGRSGDLPHGWWLCPRCGKPCNAKAGFGDDAPCFGCIAKEIAEEEA